VREAADCFRFVTMNRFFKEAALAPAGLAHG
jgi:hypothetical protein